MYYEKEAISKPLYDWLLKNNYADANLIAKWKKQGYEKVFYILSSFALIYIYPSHMGKKNLTNHLSTYPALLPPMHPDQGDELQRHVHLPRSEGSTQGRPDDSMRQLWLQRVLE